MEIDDAHDGNAGVAAMGVGATMGVEGSEGGGSLSLPLLTRLCNWRES